MKNVFWAFLRKGLVLVAALVYWVLDDLVIFLPANVVSSLGGLVFRWLGNGYRFKEFETFWYKLPEEEESE
jgi:hypothetical protein